jgi:hypothetical protein
MKAGKISIKRSGIVLEENKKKKALENGTIWILWNKFIML